MSLVLNGDGGGSPVDRQGREISVPTQSPFANVAARDSWALSNLNSLRNTTAIVTHIQLGGSDGDWYRWSGTDKPTSTQYNNEKGSSWEQVSQVLDESEAKKLVAENLTSGKLPMITGGTIADSIASQSGVGSIMIDGSIGSTKDTVDIGGGMSLSEDGTLVRVRDKLENRSLLLAGTLLNSDKSTGNNVAYSRDTPANAVVQSVQSDTRTGNLTAWFPITSTRIINNLTSRFGATATKIRVTMRDSADQTTTNGIVLYQSHTDAEFAAGNGFDVSDANKTLTLPNSAKLVSGRFVYLVIEQHSSGTGTLTLKGHNTTIAGVSQFYPYLEQSTQTETQNELALKSDTSASSTVTKLEALTGNSRLSASALKDLPRYAHEIALHFNASSDETSDNITAGTLVVETESYTLDGVSYLGVVKDRGLGAADIRLPRGIIIEDLAANSRAQGNLFVEGGITITSSTFIGKSIQQGNIVYVERTGSGANESWRYTTENRPDTFYLGEFLQPVNTATGTYEVYLNFALLRAQRIAEDAGVVEHYVNDSGSTQFAGYGAVLSYKSGSDKPVAKIPPTGDLPEVFYLQDTANGSLGAFARNRTFEDVEVHGNGSVAHLQVLTQGDKIYYIPGLAKPEFTTTATTHKEAGFVLASSYKLPITNTFDADYSNSIQVNISTAGQVNAHKNKTYILPNQGSATTLSFRESDPVGSSEQNTAWSVGDRITFITRAGSNVTFNFAVGDGTVNFRNLAGNNITSRTINPSSQNDQSITLEVESDRVWKVIAVNEGVISNDVFISLDKMNNLRIDDLEQNITDITDLAGNALLNYFMDGKITWNSNTQVTLGTFTVRDDDNSVMISSGTTMHLNPSSVGNGGLDTGSEAASTWYYVWAMKNVTNNQVQVRLSASATSPTLPSGFTKKRLLGAIYNDSSSNIRRFYMEGKRNDKKVIWDAEVAALSNGSATTKTDISCAAHVPVIHGAYPVINGIFEYEQDISIFLSDSSNQHCYLNTSSGNYGTSELSGIVLSSSGNFAYRAQQSGANAYFKVLSFDMEL